jgi:hypothetical protein
MLYVSSSPLNHLRSRHVPDLGSQSPECLGSPGCKENFFATSKALEEGYVEIWGLPSLQPHMSHLFLHNPPPRFYPRRQYPF